MSPPTYKQTNTKRFPADWQAGLSLHKSLPRLKCAKKFSSLGPIFVLAEMEIFAFIEWLIIDVLNCWSWITALNLNQSYLGGLDNRLNIGTFWPMFVAHLLEQFLLTQEDSGSNPAIVKFTVNCKENYKHRVCWFRWTIQWQYFFKCHGFTRHY